MHFRSLAAVALLVIAVLPARAAGGHFDVDDASVLDAEHCQLELWVLRAPAAGTTLAHAGSACRLGPVELGLNLDRLWSSTPGTSRDSVGPQLKWVADPLVERLSVGVVWAAAFDPAHGGGPAQTLYLPLTWWAGETLQIHANLGVDRQPDGTRSRRQGIAGEWIASDRFSVIAERVRIVGDWSSRVGGRVTLSPGLTLDLSAARVGPRAERVYVVGLNREFSR